MVSKISVFCCFKHLQHLILVLNQQCFHYYGTAPTTMDHSEDIEALSFEEANTSPSTPKPDIITPEKTSSEINVEMKVSMEQYDSVKKSAFSRAKVSFPTGFSENLTAWASVTSLMVITIPIGMPLYGIGLLIMDMRDELQTSTTLIGWIVSMSFFLNSSFAPIAGILVTSENFLSYIKVRFELIPLN